jgi:hypothetical protein
VKIHLIGQKAPTNDGFDLKFGMGMIFGARKVRVMSEIQNFPIFQLFLGSVTSQTAQILKILKI